MVYILFGIIVVFYISIRYNRIVYDIIDITKSKSEFKIGSKNGRFRLIFCSNWAHERKIFSDKMLNQPSLHFSVNLNFEYLQYREFGNNLWSLKAENILDFTFTGKMNNLKALSKHSLIRMGFIDDIHRSISFGAYVM